MCGIKFPINANLNNCFNRNKKKILQTTVTSPLVPPSDHKCTGFQQ